MPSVLAALAALAALVSAASGAQELWASAAPMKLVPAMMPWPFFYAERCFSHSRLPEFVRIFYILIYHVLLPPKVKPMKSLTLN